MVFKDAAVKEEPQELSLRRGERRGQKAICAHSEDPNEWCLPLFDSDWNALCQTLYGGVDQEGWESMYNTLRESAPLLRDMKGQVTFCSLEDQDGGPPYMQDDLAWRIGAARGGLTSILF